MNAEDPNENSSIVNKNDSVKTELPPIAPEFDASEIENHLRNKLSSKKESVTIENQKKDYSFGMFITNITLTGATICLVFFGYFQFSTYKDAVQTEFRAYINPKVYCSIVAQNHDSILFLVNYGVNFENIGKIPAQNLQYYFQRIIATSVPILDESAIDDSIKTRNKNIVTPAHPLEDIDFNYTITKKELDSLINTNIKFYLFGKIIYDDFKGDHHYYKFLLEYDIATEHKSQCNYFNDSN